MRTVLLLICSNIFMTVAWYGHLRYRSTALWKVILISWFIALSRIRVAGSGQSNRVRRVHRAAAQASFKKSFLDLGLHRVLPALP